MSKKASKRAIRICKSMTVDNTMREFKMGELKDKNQRVIKNAKQAVAIGLSAASKCPLNLSYDYLDKNYKKEKLIYFLKKDELQELVKAKYKDWNKLKGTKEDLGKLLHKKDIINYLKK